MERFFGGNPGLVLIRLVIISVIVGVLLSALGLNPWDIIDSFKQLLIRIYNMGFDAIDWILRYFLLGAVIVFPVWLVARIIRLMGKGDDADSGVYSKSRHSDV